MSVFLIFPLFH